jgi:hypothetical protein
MDLDEGEVENDGYARKFHFVFVFAHLFAFLANSCLAWKMLFGGIAQELGGHNLHVANKDVFEAEAGAEIERLVKGEVDG